MAIDRAAELRAAADEIAPRWPWIAAHLRAAAAAPPDRRSTRRRILREIQRQHFADADRTVAARLIASAWSRWGADPDREDLPHSLSAAFARLHRAGCRPLRWRRIADLLDDALG